MRHTIGARRPSATAEPPEQTTDLQTEPVPRRSLAEDMPGFDFSGLDEAVQSVPAVARQVVLPFDPGTTRPGRAVRPTDDPVEDGAWTLEGFANTQAGGRHGRSLTGRFTVEAAPTAEALDQLFWNEFNTTLQAAFAEDSAIRRYHRMQQQAAVAEATHLEAEAAHQAASERYEQILDGEVEAGGGPATEALVAAAAASRVAAGQAADALRVKEDLERRLARLQQAAENRRDELSRQIAGKIGQRLDERRADLRRQVLATNTPIMAELLLVIEGRELLLRQARGRGAMLLNGEVGTDDTPPPPTPPVPPAAQVQVS